MSQNLIDALKPFAKLADAFTEDLPDNTAIGFMTGGDFNFGPDSPTLGDCRTARALLLEHAAPTSPYSVVDLLVETRQSFDHTTWVQGFAALDENCNCLVTALHASLTKFYPDVFSLEKVEATDVAGAMALRDSAARIIHDLLPTFFQKFGDLDGRDHRSAIMNYNDASDRTREDILLILDRAILVAKHTQV